MTRPAADVEVIVPLSKHVSYNNQAPTSLLFALDTTHLFSLSSLHSGNSTFHRNSMARLLNSVSILLLVLSATFLHPQGAPF